MMLAEFEITNTFAGSSTPVVNQRSRVLGVKWLTPPAAGRDTVR